MARPAILVLLLGLLVLPCAAEEPAEEPQLWIHTRLRDETVARAFPAEEHTVDMPDEEWEALLAEVDDV